ncbi:MAG: hypothetical protein AAGF11_23245 [Myxococcota bacterium]
MIRSLCHNKHYLLSAAVLWTFAACDTQEEPWGELDEDAIVEASALADEPDEAPNDESDESAAALDEVAPSGDLRALPDELAAFGQCLNATCEIECACDQLRCEIECIPDGMNPSLCHDYCYQQYTSCISTCP